MGQFLPISFAINSITTVESLNYRVKVPPINWIYSTKPSTQFFLPLFSKRIAPTFMNLNLPPKKL